LLEGGRRELAGLFEISPVRAGLYTVGFMRTPVSSATAEAAALACGVETIGLHRLTRAEPDSGGLLLGFAAFDENRIRKGMLHLARALQQPQS
jgi:GntR family transcriptional regulator / MocR family aminotransferase